jgi:hypothetical protein
MHLIVTSYTFKFFVMMNLEGNIGKQVCVIIFSKQYYLYLQQTNINEN